MFRNVKVGTKLWSIQSGECEVVYVIKHDEYPVKCRDKGGYFSYTYDGKEFATHSFPSLYWSKPKIIAPEAPKVEPVRPERGNLWGYVSVDVEAYRRLYDEDPNHPHLKGINLGNYGKKQEQWWHHNYWIDVITKSTMYRKTITISKYKWEEYKILIEETFGLIAYPINVDVKIDKPEWIKDEE